MMKMLQYEIQLKEHRRGFHLVTEEILRSLTEIATVNTGLCHIFIQHTSASLTLNENADPTVRKDFEMFFNKAVPENDPKYTHDTEGPDDITAHLKAALL